MHKTRASQVSSSEKLLCLKSELATAAELVASVLKREQLVMFLLDVCPTWTRGVALVDLLRQSALRREKPWDTR
jgi:hypothetical protein